jgi:HEAT repeat protein
MSEMRLSADEVDRWQAWFDTQYTWWQANRDRLEEELRSRDPGHVLAAIKVLSERRLFRHEVAEVIAAVVDHPRASIARTACTSLERLGSRRVVPPLVAALERSDESVREAATQALCTLTGADLPADAEAWADYLR